MDNHSDERKMSAVNLSDLDETVLDFFKRIREEIPEGPLPILFYAPPTGRSNLSIDFLCRNGVTGMTVHQPTHILDDNYNIQILKHRPKNEAFHYNLEAQFPLPDNLLDYFEVDSLPKSFFEKKEADYLKKKSFPHERPKKDVHCSGLVLNLVKRLT